MRINEPVEIKVTVISKIDGHINVILTTPLVTDAYKTVEGLSQIDKRIDALNVTPDWTETYTWTITPTGEWTNGNAPINIFVQFHKGMDDDKYTEFTLANPYILNEHYSGPTRTTSDPSSTNQSSSQGSPGFGVVGALLGILLAVVYRARRA